MAGVDNRIVTMKFDNAQFKTGATETLSLLEKLKASMNFGTIGTAASKALGGISGLFNKFGIKNPFATATTGAADLSKAAQSAGTVGLTSLDGAVTGVSNKFIAMSTIAITALSNITSKFISSGTAWANSFTFAPIMDGLHEYETNLKAIQTVQANTDRPLPEINAALEQLNAYSDQTIYNFGEMAKNVGTFTAAGVDLETSVSSIKGIANMAALSGSSSEQAATAMYQLSQAIASGKVGLMDWNSVVNAGMGGKKLQGALAQTAIAMGDIDKAAVKGVESGEQLTIMGQSFRESIMAQPGQESWLSSEILTNSLAALDGRYSRAALSAETLADGTLKYKNAAEVTAQIEKERNAAAKEGIVYSDEQFMALQKLSTSSFEAATKVKTLGQVFDIAKETIASGWSASFKSIFGDLEEAKALFTGMSEGLNGLIKDNALARNEMLAAWNEGGGRADVIEGLKNAWEAVWSIITRVSKGFRDIFPKQTADSLISMSEGFKDFTENLMPGKETLRNIRDIAGGVFAVFGIGVQILGGVVDGFKALFAGLGSGGGDFLSFAGGIGNALKAFNSFLEESGIITSFFTGLGTILSVPLRLLANFAGVLASLFTGFDSGGAGGAIGKMDEFGNSADKLADGADRVMSVFSGLGDLFDSVVDTVVDAVGNLGQAIGDAISPATFNGSLDVIKTGLLGGIALMIRNFFKGGLSIDVGGGFFSSVKETLGAATGVLQNMQANLKADILLKLAAALGVMALSLLLLASIDSGDLTKALTAMGVGFGVLGATMVLLLKYIGPIGAMKLPLISAAMIGLATALLLFAGAMKILGGMDLYEIARGLVGISGVLFVLKKSMDGMDSPGMVRSAAAILILGVALNVLAVAMKVFATMSWGEMIKGLAGVAGALTAIAIGMQLMPKGMLLQAASILILSVALNALGIAMKIFATMSWGEMAKGAAALAGSLTIIALAMRLMPKSLPLTAAGLVLVAVALNGIATAIKIMGGMSWEEIAKGMVALGGSIAILAIGLNAMGPLAILGAAALVVTAAALAVLTPVLLTMGAMSWEMIIKSLTTLAGIFVVLGLAAYVLAPLTPVLIGLGAALVLIGAGLALAGVGALGFAAAFGTIVAAGAAGVSVLGGILGQIIQAIPPFFAALGQALVQFAVSIAKNAGIYARAMGAIISAMLDAVIKNVPKMGRAFMAMLNTALRVIGTMTPKIIATGFRLIIGFLSAIEQNIGKIVDLAARIIVNFIDGIARNLGRIIQSGVNLIIKFINGVATAIENNSTQMGEAGGRLAIAMVTGMANGIRGAAGVIKDAAMDAARAAWEEVKDFFKIGSPSKLMRDDIGRWLPIGMALGIRDEEDAPALAIERMGHATMDKLSRTMAAVEEGFAMNADLDPTITPVLDLSALTKEANKMSDILATAPIMAGVSYQTASDISAMTQASAEDQGGPDEPGTGGGDTYVTLEQHNHSPKPIDSVTVYRGGKTLISLAKEALK